VIGVIILGVIILGVIVRIGIRVLSHM